MPSKGAPNRELLESISRFSKEHPDGDKHFQISKFILQKKPEIKDSAALRKFASDLRRRLLAEMPAKGSEGFKKIKREFPSKKLAGVKIEETRKELWKKYEFVESFRKFLNGHSKFEKKAGRK